MMHGRNNGKKMMAVRIVQQTFEIIHLMTGENPIQVLINAICNVGPREDCSRVGSAGTVRFQSVDVSPFRRVNQGISLLVVGSRKQAFRTSKTIAEVLAGNIVAASKGDECFAINKKNDIERVAMLNR